MNKHVIAVGLCQLSCCVCSSWSGNENETLRCNSAPHQGCQCARICRSSPGDSFAVAWESLCNTTLTSACTVHDQCCLHTATTRLPGMRLNFAPHSTAAWLQGASRNGPCTSSCNSYNRPAVSPASVAATATNQSARQLLDKSGTSSCNSYKSPAADQSSLPVPSGFIWSSRPDIFSSVSLIWSTLQ